MHCLLRLAPMMIHHLTILRLTNLSTEGVKNFSVQPTSNLDWFCRNFHWHLSSQQFPCWDVAGGIMHGNQPGFNFNYNDLRSMDHKVIWRCCFTTICTSSTTQHYYINVDKSKGRRKKGKDFWGLLWNTNHACLPTRHIHPPISIQPRNLFPLYL